MRHALPGAMGGVAGLAPHVLHHVGLLAGTACLRTTLRRPRQAAALFLGSAAVTLSYVAALASTAAALRLDLSLLEVAAAYLAGAALASAVPTPSGLGAAKAALSASLVAVGATVGPAVAAVLAFRLVTFWLPILPGALALHWLQSRQSL